jgi:hypothetical protein
MTWLLPTLILLLTAALAVPLGLYMARVLDRPGAGNAVERLIDTGPQGWKSYCFAMLGFNVVVFLLGFAVLATQPWHPAFLNPDGKKMLAPSTIFNTACSFVSNTNLQHYSGEVHLSYGSQLFAILYNQFVTPAIGLAALLAVIRGLRGDTNVGNFYLDVWRGTIYVLLPLALIVGLLLLLGGVPMTLDGAQPAATLEGGQDGQTLARGPVAAVVAIKQLGTNGGGFFGANSAHPFENPNAWTNLVECVCIILVPFAGVVLFGKMLKNLPHAGVIAAVMGVVLVSFLVWAVATDTHAPNAALAGKATLRDAAGEMFDIDYRDAAWAERYPTLRDGWLQDNAAAVKTWQEENPSDKEFFAAFAAANPRKWPAVEERRVTPADGGDEVRKTFFDLWLQDPAGGRGAELEKVPADYVTASGSGLDPHISLRNARFQTPRVVEERARLYREGRAKASRPVPGVERTEAAVRREVDRLVDDHAFSPMWGPAGGDQLVNVLELNLALDEAMSKLAVE